MSVQTHTTKETKKDEMSQSAINW